MSDITAICIITELVSEGWDIDASFSVRGAHLFAYSDTARPPARLVKIAKAYGIKVKKETGYVGKWRLS